MKKQLILRNLFTACMVVVSAVLQTFVIQTFILPASLLSGGFTGIAILAQRISALFGGGEGIPLYLTLLCINIPVGLLCAKGISRRFTIFTFSQVALASILLRTMHFAPIYDDVFLNVIFGGFFNGVSIVLALKGGASTGGTDFIALYISNIRGQAIWEFVFVFNFMLLAIFGAMFGWELAGYSILFQFISTRTISAFHHRYEQLTLQVTTVYPEAILDHYVANHKHGVTCIEGVGGYSHRKIFLLQTVISSYELTEVVRGIQQVDPHAIINVMRTQRFYGNFYREKE